MCCKTHRCKTMRDLQMAHAQLPFLHSTNKRTIVLNDRLSALSMFCRPWYSRQIVLCTQNSFPEIRHTEHIGSALQAQHETLASSRTITRVRRSTTSIAPRKERQQPHLSDVSTALHQQRKTTIAKRNIVKSATDEGSIFRCHRN
jgi:hypothetical protein